MNKRATGSQYALGGTPIVDVRIGDAFPIVEEVYRYLDQLNYLAENAEKLVSKQIEFRANLEEETIEWRYEDEDWIVLASFSELLKIDINSIENSEGSGLESGGTVTGTLNMSSAPTDKIKLGALSLTGSSTYVGFGDSSDPFKVRIYTDGALTSFGQFLITTGQIRADASYSTTVAESANVNIGAAGYFRRSTSSLRYKDCVEDVEDELMQAVIDEARPIWYRSLCKDDDRDMSWWGLGAEELGAIDPRFVHWAHPIVPTEIVEQIEVQEPTGEIDENGNPITRTVIREERRIENRPDSSQPKQAEGVMYDRLVVPLLWHAKKMQARIEALEARLAALEITP